MSEEPPRPEPDRAEGAFHPRHTMTLVGQQAAEAQFLEAFNSQRLHHAWMITGPRGVGKATLAWKIARFLLASGDRGSDLAHEVGDAIGTLDVPADHPITRRTAALSEPRLFLLRRPYDEKSGRLRQEITVDEVRRLKSFFSLSSADGGRRVVVIDSADELNTSAANALLKVLEEPPRNATLLLVSHQPSRLLPTIRSRCRELRCLPLSPLDMSSALAAAGVEVNADPAALADLAAGSAGAAIRISNEDGLSTYSELIGVLSEAPGFDRSRALKISDSVAGRGAETRLDLLLALFDLLLARLARAGSGMQPAAEAAQGEAAFLARMAPTADAARHWATLQQELGARARHGRAVNLDPSSLILDMVLKISDTAERVSAR